MSPKHLRLVIFASLFLLWASYLDSHLFSQSHAAQEPAPLQFPPNHSGTSWNTAANRWQLTAIDPKSQVDTVSPTVRAQRNANWKRVLEPLRPIPGTISGTIGSYGPGPIPEFKVEPGDVWAIAKFEQFHVFEIDHDPELIYTEMNFRVDHVFRQPAGLSLSAGSLVAVGVRGGRIKAANGDIESPAWFQSTQFFPQVGHTYLIQLLYEPQGNFFMPGSLWDISSGKVQVEGMEKERAAEGKSAIAGMSVDELIKSFPSILPKEPKR